jgi:hypothetical protein
MLKLSNATLTVRRRVASTQGWQVLLSNIRANVQQAAPGTVEPTDQWAPTSITEQSGSYMSRVNIFIGGTDETGVLYYPSSGDQLIVTGTTMLNGTYIQIAEGAIHEGYGLDYIKMPSLRFTLLTDFAALDNL